MTDGTLAAAIQRAVESPVRMPALQLAEMMERREASAVEVNRMTAEIVSGLDNPLGLCTFQQIDRALNGLRHVRPGISRLAGIGTWHKDSGAGCAGDWMCDGTRIRHQLRADTFLGAFWRDRLGVHWMGSTSVPDGCVGSHTWYTGNPWAPGYTVGGSSGGSAALVALTGRPSPATGVGGSLGLPANRASIVGHRPLKCLVPSNPGEPWPINRLLTDAPLTATVSDAAMILDELIRANPACKFPPGYLQRIERPYPRRLRIGYVDASPVPFMKLHPECRANVLHTVRYLSQSHDVFRVDVASLGDQAAMIRDGAGLAGAFLNHKFKLWKEWKGAPLESSDMHPFAWNLGLWGQGLWRTQQVQSIRGLFAQGARIAKRFPKLSAQSSDVADEQGDYDLLLLPPALTPPMPREWYSPPNGHGMGAEGRGMSEFLRDAKYRWFGAIPMPHAEMLTHIYARKIADICFEFPFYLFPSTSCAIPVGFTLDGLPIGLNLVGTNQEDLLRVAFRIEQDLAIPFEHRRPQGELLQ